MSRSHDGVPWGAIRVPWGLSPGVGPPNHRVFLLDEHEVMKEEPSQTRGPDFFAENAAKDDVVHRLGDLITEDAHIAILQPMSVSPMCHLVTSMHHQLEEELNPRWHRDLPDKLCPEWP